MLPATPAKLYSGEWGARVDGTAIEIGAEILITTRGGKSWRARVTAVQWQGPDHAVCATESLDPKPARAPRGRRGGRSRGSTYTRFNSGAEVYTNRNGRCEDAPCCGCCT
jgi:hypothetical protein